MPDIELVGFGGERMEEQGVRLWKTFNSYNLMGVWEVLRNLRRVWKLMEELTDHMKREKPDLLVIIDYPDFNFRLAKRAKKLGIPVFSFIPPSAWAWRRGRAKDYGKVMDRIVPIFPFEMKPYEEAGANVSFLGNPLVDIVETELSTEEAKGFFGIGEEPIVLLMPGSRRQEIQRIFPTMLDAAKLLLEARPETRFYLPVADGIEESELRDRIGPSEVPVTLVYEHRYELMGLADAAMATSGTVLVEAALMNLPCVILYRMGNLNYFIGKHLVKVKYIGLPNILLGRGAQTELLQEDANPGRVAEETLRLYRGEAHREAVMEALEEVRRRLGGPGATERIVGQMIELARSNGGRA